jgi:hypothetical protein
MLSVELIYDTDCPNVNETRSHLVRAFTEAGLTPRWQEWNRSAPDSPAYARAYGSPTILINGQDVAGASTSAAGDSCRVYPTSGGHLRGIPSVEAITSALLTAKRAVSLDANAVPIQMSRRRSTLAVFPAIGTALLPKLTCPACWPAYAGLLSLLGLGFINYTPYLFPLTALFLILAVGSLGYGAKTRRGYGPFILGVIAAIIVIVGKFVFTSDWAMYGGIALLMAATVWNVWPQRSTNLASGPACVPAGPGLNLDQGAHSTSERRKDL